MTDRADRRRPVVLSGAIAQRPGIGGHAWVFVNWLEGLRAAGCDVLLVDRLDASMLDDPESPLRVTPQWRWFREVVSACGAGQRAALIDDRDGSVHGMSWADLERHCNNALLFDVMGYLRPASLLAEFRRRVFVDIDPGWPQLWRAQGLHDAFAGYDAVVSVGLAIGSPSCSVPEVEIPVVTTVPPVAIERWPHRALPRLTRPRWTSVCTWRGANAPVDHDGRRLGLRVHTARGLLDLPARVRCCDLELALAIDDFDDADAEALAGAGWRLADPACAAGDLARYQRYIAGSTGELMIAKELYVATKGGWFSDRSACYLASGRPVVAQDTGFSSVLPVGEGLLAFDDLDGAVEAIEQVNARPERHAEAARRLAVELFDAGRVATRVLEQVEALA